MTVDRRAARAILIDDRGRLVLIKRTKPGQTSYWTAPGDGVQDTDTSVEVSLYRELAEELGAHVMNRRAAARSSAIHRGAGTS